MDVAVGTVAADVMAEAEEANLTAEDKAADDMAAAMAVAEAAGGNTGGLLGGQKGPVINQAPSCTSRAWRGEGQRQRWRVLQWEEWLRQPLPPEKHDSAPAGAPFA